MIMMVLFFKNLIFFQRCFQSNTQTCHKAQLISVPALDVPFSAEWSARTLLKWKKKMIRVLQLRGLVIDAAKSSNLTKSFALFNAPVTWSRGRRRRLDSRNKSQKLTTSATYRYLVSWRSAGLLTSTTDSSSRTPTSAVWTSPPPAQQTSRPIPCWGTSNSRRAMQWTGNFCSSTSERR